MSYCVYTVSQKKFTFSCLWLFGQMLPNFDNIW